MYYQLALANILQSSTSRISLFLQQLCAGAAQTKIRLPLLLRQMNAKVGHALAKLLKVTNDLRLSDAMSVHGKT